MPYKDKDDKKRKVRRLVDVDVSHVSLVDRPANRTPFKFIKRDETETEKGVFPMNIHLKNMFGARAPEVTSVMADTEAKALAVAKMLMTDGEAKVTQHEGIFIVRKAGTEGNPDERVVHLGKRAGVAYTIANVRKELALYDMEGDGFDDAVKQEGFVPGLMVGMDALHTTIRNIAMSEDTNSPDVFRDKVGKAMEDFAKYVDGLIGNLPEKAFKFEKAVAAVGSAAGKPVHFTPEGFSAEVYDAVFGGEAPNPSATMADAAPAAPETPETPADASATPATPEAAETPAPAPEQAADTGTPKPANLEELPAHASKEVPDIEGALRSALADLTKSVGEQIAAAMNPLAQRLDVTDAAMAKLTKAVGGTVATTPEEDGNVVHLTKGTETGGYSGGEPPLMDTAYNVKRG